MSSDAGIIEMGPPIRQSKPRLTVVEMVYHFPLRGNVAEVESRYSRDLQSEEQTWQRYAKALEEWALLECGWIDKSGLVVIQNTEGRFLQTQPTDEERLETSKKILEVTYDPDSKLCFLVPPKESMRVYPSDANLLWIRSRSGIATYTLTVLPE